MEQEELVARRLKHMHKHWLPRFALCERFFVLLCIQAGMEARLVNSLRSKHKKEGMLSLPQQRKEEPQDCQQDRKENKTTVPKPPATGALQCVQDAIHLHLKVFQVPTVVDHQGGELTLCARMRVFVCMFCTFKFMGHRSGVHACAFKLYVTYKCVCVCVEGEK